MALTPSATDKFTKVGEPGSATTLSAPGYTIGDTTINVAATTNWPTDTKVIFAIDRAEVANGVEVRVSGTYNEYEGIVAGSGVITSLDHRLGTDQDYAAGSLTRVYIPVAATRENDMVEGLNQDHNGKGNHKSLTDDNDNEWLERGSVAGAVNHVKVQNAATGDPAIVEVEGGDTNIDLSVKAKGIGHPALHNVVAFRAHRVATKTIAASSTPVEHDTESYDYGSNFDASTGIFTAPWDGIYMFNAALSASIGVVQTRAVVYVICSTAGTFTVADLEGADIRGASGSVCVELAASETVKVNAFCNVSADVASLATWFSGHLVGRTD